jgi:hypothetical protein
MSYLADAIIEQRQGIWKARQMLKAMFDKHYPNSPLREDMLELDQQLMDSLDMLEAKDQISLQGLPMRPSWSKEEVPTDPVSRR